jgi:hypothetical protein
MGTSSTRRHTGRPPSAKPSSTPASSSRCPGAARTRPNLIALKSGSRGHLESPNASEFLPAESSRPVGASGRPGASVAGRRHRERERDRTRAQWRWGQAVLAGWFRRGSHAPRPVLGRRWGDGAGREERGDPGCARPGRQRESERESEREYGGTYGHRTQWGSGLAPVAREPRRRRRRSGGAGTAGGRASGRPAHHIAEVEHLEVGAATHRGTPPPGRRTEPGRPTTVGSYGP